MGIAKQFLKRCEATLVLVSDDLKELDLVARRLDLAHQVCHFDPSTSSGQALLRWLCHALEKLRKQLAFALRMLRQPAPRVALDEEHRALLDQVWELMKTRPADGRTRLFALWKGIPVRRARDEQTSALYRLRLLLLKMHDNWEKYTLDQREAGIPSTNYGTERAIGRWRIRSHSTRGFKSWAGFEGAFLLCGSEIE